MKAFYAGSFDPFTIGHLYVAQQALNMFGALVIAIGVNEQKKVEVPVSERIRKIRDRFVGMENVEIISYSELTAEAAKKNGAGVLVRGVRNALDFEKEKELADINLEVFGLPTVFIPAPPELGYVSSSMVRELKHFGYDTKRFEV